MIITAHTMVYIFVVLTGLISVANSLRYDCCSQLYSGISPRGCEIPYRNTTTSITYYCLSVAENCDSCSIGVNITSTSCFQCCVGFPSVEEVDENTCGSPYAYVTATSWTLIFIILAGSCCCCSVVFLSAEHNRMKEGLSFREAYLLPIPIVTAEVNFDDKEINFPIDQPTAVARAHSTFDIPVAEPTEHSPFIGLYRESNWES